MKRILYLKLYGWGRASATLRKRHKQFATESKTQQVYIYYCIYKDLIV